MLKGLHVENSTFVSAILSNKDSDLDNSLYLALIDWPSASGRLIKYRRILGGDK